MIKKLLIVPVALLAMAGAAFGTGIQFTSGGNGQGSLAGGANIPATFTFQLGSFGSFTPTIDNAGDWSSNFSSSGLLNATTQWIPLAANPAYGQFNGTATMTSAELTGQQGFIWGYEALDVGAQWILITNSNWIFPSPSTPPLPIDPPWQTTAEGTTMVFGGTFNHAGLAGAANTANRLLETQAIPEPSTYALIFGLGALGFLGFRRLRK